MHWIQPIIFILLLSILAYFSVGRYKQIWNNIKRGKEVGPVDDKPQRWKNMLLIALGQKKMFKNVIPAVLHLFIYTAFLITQIELIEIIIDGITGNHRLFAPFLGGFYTFIISFIEVLSALALIATIAFFARRNILKVARFQKPELKGWPFKDANLILLGELLLVIGIFTMNGADIVLQKLDPAHYHPTGNFAISSVLGPALFGALDKSTLMFLERFGWWLHCLIVFGFIAYLPFSKHLHIFLAFPNTFFASLKPKGEMMNMPAIQREVEMMIDPSKASTTAPPAPLRFGAKDIEDLTQVQLLSAYSCTECGRCTAACPANQTGKLLSPRKVMMDVRDRMEELSTFEKMNGAETKDDRSLLDYISRAELMACTTCNACAEACPININPMGIIIDLRRYYILDEAKSPEEWNMMFSNIENNGAPWKFSAMDRANWSLQDA